ncbi:hypothetical protein PJN91_17180 [Mycobacterium kansasii]
MDTRDLTPGDRRELRALVKKQFAVLRNDVKRRKDELVCEIESELLRRYRDQDERIEQARRAIEAARSTYKDTVSQIVSGLRATDPTLEIYTDYGNKLLAQDTRRTQLHKALIASVPQQIADASTKLDQQELELLRDLTLGALDTSQAQQFLSRIPTVGELVPKARLAELDGPQS